MGLIRLNEPTQFNEETAAALKKKIRRAVMVIDTETSGNEVEKHGLLSLSSMDFFNPSLNFSYRCNLRPGARISLFDIQKNRFGHGANITEIINPNAQYPPLRDHKTPFIEPFDRQDWDGETYLKFERLVQSVILGQKPGKGYIPESVIDLAAAHYDWMNKPAQNNKFTFHAEEFGHIALTPLGHNVDFDCRFADDAYRRAGIGAFERVNMIWDREGDSTEFVNYRPFALSFRGRLDIGQLVEDHIHFTTDPKEISEFNRRSRTNTGQDVPIPYLFAGSGITLDYACEYVGLPKRPDPRQSTKEHDDFEDVLYTAEVAARIFTGMPYMKQFENYPLTKFVEKK